MGVGGDQLQPGVEDGGTPIEVVAGIELKNRNKTENSTKKRGKQENQQQKKEGPEYPGEGAAKTSAAGPF